MARALIWFASGLIELIFLTDLDAVELEISRTLRTLRMTFSAVH